MESDEEEKINQKKIEEQNIFSEDEIINSIDMKVYKDRIENLIGKQYSYLFFVYFENIYHSKIKNKMSLPLTEHLDKDNNMNVSFWMRVYKAIKFYSKENLPVIITKYFNLKAEQEFKFLYNESKKYTSTPYKFFDIYLKKMKKANQKKLSELKAINPNFNNIFNLNKKQSFFIKSFLSKKTVISPKLSFIRNQINVFNQEDEHSELSNKEEEVKKKKELRLQIIKQVHQLKINSIKEVEIANMFQNKQKKKYGGIKSRFLDIYNEQGKLLQIINSRSSKKITHNNFFNNKLTDFERTNLSTKRFNNISKSSNRTALYLNTRGNYSSRKNLNLNLFFPEEKKGLNYTNRNNKSLKKNYKTNKIKFNNIIGKGYTPKNLKALNYFLVDNNNNNEFQKKNENRILLTSSNINKNRKLKINKFKMKEFSKNKKLDAKDNKKNKKINFNLKKTGTDNLIEKLDKERNKEMLENLRIQKKEKGEYNNIVYNIFKRTEIM